jgi:hypothetical protein
MGTVFPHVCTTNRDLKRAEIHLENPRRDCTCLQLPTNIQIKRKKCPIPPPRRNAYMRIDSLSVWKMPVEMQSTLDDENWTDLLRFVAARIRRRRPPPVVRLRRRDPEAAPPRGYPPPPRSWSRPTSRFALRRRGLETAHLADRLRRRDPETPPRGFPPPVEALLSKQTNGKKSPSVCSVT